MLNKTFAIRLSPASKSVRDPGPIECVPIAEALTATMFMPIAVILSIGVDLSLSGGHSQAWQSAGYCVTPAESIRDAIDHIRYGDFDLVLLGDSIRIGDRERLAFLIRALGSRVPVVCITDSPSDCAAFADATVNHEPTRLLQCIGELLAAQAGKPAARRAARTGS
jgi:hypothetical protein